MENLNTIKYFFKKIVKVFKLDSQKNKPNVIPKSHKKSLTFTPSETPKVSIIIPFYNQFDYTLNCLEFLNKKLSNKYPYEIILINDNSTETFDFSTIKGITVINNSENLGFLRNINKGIQVSKGEFIYLLNNDTEVQKGFLDELFYVFEKFPNVGAVGSKLLNPDGTLQEAGSVFRKNYEIANIFQKKKPFFPEINYIYKVDYCSGCSILFKKYNDKGELNLFDEQFIPAYFEETDLCFNLKHIQKKDIYYTPFSVVMHYNGISYNSKKNVDPNKIKLKEQLLEKNREKFKQKWKREIDNINASNIDERILELYDNKSMVLFCDLIPIPNKDAESIKFKEIISHYKNLGYRVTILKKNNFIGKSSEKNPVEFYQRLGVNVFYEHKKINDFEDYLQRQKSNQCLALFYNQKIYSEYKDIVKKHLPQAKIIMADNIMKLQYKSSPEN